MGRKLFYSRWNHTVKCMRKIKFDPIDRVVILIVTEDGVVQTF